MHSLNHLIQQADDWRVQWRSRWVELRVRAQSTDHLPNELKQARQRNLDELRRYAQRGIFPRNRQHAKQMPVFIDPDGRRCAVAHLVTESGHVDVAHTISQQANFALVPAMHFPQLDTWAQANGFTRAELARIQPTYGPYVSDPLLFHALMATANNYLNILGFILLVGLGSLVLQIAAMFRRRSHPRWSVWMITSGLVAAVFSRAVIADLLAAVYLLFVETRPGYMQSGIQYLWYSTTEMFAIFGFWLGSIFVGLGVLMLALRQWRTRQHPQNAQRITTQPE